MYGVTLAQAETMLSALLSATPDSSGAISVSLPDKTVTYRSLDELNKAIEFWDQKVRRLARGGLRVRGVSPIP